MNIWTALNAAFFESGSWLWLPWRMLFAWRKKTVPFRGLFQTRTGTRVEPPHSFLTWNNATVRGVGELNSTTVTIRPWMPLWRMLRHNTKKLYEAVPLWYRCTNDMREHSDWNFQFHNSHNDVSQQYAWQSDQKRDNWNVCVIRCTTLEVSWHQCGVRNMWIVVARVVRKSYTVPTWCVTCFLVEYWNL